MSTLHSLSVNSGPSALGKYSLAELDKNGVGSLRREVAEMLGMEFVYAPCYESRLA